MPTDITTYLSAMDKNGESTALHQLYRLDEGHHSAVWQSMLGEDSKVVPSSPDLILFEGLALMASDKSGRQVTTAAEINAALADYEVGVTVTDPLSSIPKLFGALKDQGIDLVMRLINKDH